LAQTQRRRGVERAGGRARHPAPCRARRDRERMEEEEGGAMEGGAADDTTREPDAERDVSKQDDSEVLIEELDESGQPKKQAAADAAADEKDEDTPDGEMRRIEEEKKDMSAEAKLERANLWKADGNDHYKKGLIFQAADAYYHAILYARDLTQNPQYYPKIGHNEEQRRVAMDLCESTFTNLALVQTKYAGSLLGAKPERSKALNEAVKSASEALKLNARNVKALYRRGVARAMLAKDAKANAEAQQFCCDAKSDFLAVVQEDSSNRDARSELKSVQDHLKQLKREEIAGEKREFSFASTLSALGSKEKDLLGDGSVRKIQQVKAGDGGSWLNDYWLRWDGATKCIVHVRCSLLPADGARSANSSKDAVAISFILGDPEMHEGINAAVKSMTVGEVAQFAITPSRMAADSSVARLLPNPPEGGASTWEVTFVKFVTWEDLDRNGQRLQKVQNEGYGNFPEPLAELHAHWRVIGTDGGLVHSTRYTLNMGGAGGGLKHVEDEDKEPVMCVLGENTWEPVATLCRVLRQGGVGELWLRDVPELPKQDPGGDTGASAQLSMMMNRIGNGKALRHCIVRLELQRVVQPVAGPSDARWEGVPALIKERFHAEQLLGKGEELSALTRFRRVAAWAEQMPRDDPAVLEEWASARASVGWVLAHRAAPIFDSGTVTSDVLAVARADLAEAESHCAWLEEHCPPHAGAHLLRAKILVAQDDDFRGAHERLLEAQRLDPSDKRVQEELRHVKVELRKQEEELTKSKVLEIREGLKRARTAEHPGAGSSGELMRLLRELSETKVSWETVMDTRIGVELKSCSEAGGEDAKRLIGEILGRFKDESKEQRPLWDG